MSRILDIVNDPRRAATVGACTGALKGVLVGVVVGKVALLTVLGVAGGAVVGGGLSALRRAVVARSATPAADVVASRP